MKVEETIIVHEIAEGESVIIKYKNRNENAPSPTYLVTRVFNGWIYTMVEDGGGYPEYKNSVFVPYYIQVEAQVNNNY